MPINIITTITGGRQIEVAREILSVKNVPYFVAAPLLIQDINSWLDKGMIMMILL